jgi:hypothetical protein
MTGTIPCETVSFSSPDAKVIGYIIKQLKTVSARGKVFSPLFLSRASLAVLAAA